MSLCDRDLSLSAFDQERFYWKQTEQLLRTSREKDASKTDGTVWLDRLHTAGQAAHDEHDGHKTNLNEGMAAIKLTWTMGTTAYTWFSLTDWFFARCHYFLY